MQVQYSTLTMLLFCASVTHVVSLYGFSSTHTQCINVLLTLVHNEFYKFLIYVFLCAFILLLVFLHGCVQCFYPSSMWQSHLPLGCSICVCHHGPHHLQSQVLAPTMSSHLMSGPTTKHCAFFLDLNVVLPKSQCVSVMFCIGVLYAPSC